MTGIISKLKDIVSDLSYYDRSKLSNKIIETCESLINDINNANENSLSLDHDKHKLGNK